MQQQQSHQSAGTGKVLTGDLDSSLASLAENLTINKSASAQVKYVLGVRKFEMKNKLNLLVFLFVFLHRGVQWNSPKNAAKPASWTPQPMAATTGAGYRPMVS